MAKAAIAKSRRRAKPLYFSAKISDYQFKKVLWQFVLDRSAVEAAKHVNLSANSITAIYAKLRKFFFDYGLFNDPYRGGAPREGLPYEGFDQIDPVLLSFHEERLKWKHGSLHRKEDEPDYHLAESIWRLNYLSFHDERGEEHAYRKMLATLLLFIQRFGPVGSRDMPTTNGKIEGRLLALELLADATRWWARNSTRFNRFQKKLGVERNS